MPEKVLEVPPITQNLTDPLIAEKTLTHRPKTKRTTHLKQNKQTLNGCVRIPTNRSCGIVHVAGSIRLSFSFGFRSFFCGGVGDASSVVDLPKWMFALGCSYHAATTTATTTTTTTTF
eukprot:GHVT01033595.1.p1 GENE.GHVT01033595.1~~GHVT01033595.1.p1  ORF type:complete len:118 (-),score=19.25 GHVT01033595.1:56-409(-)